MNDVAPLKQKVQPSEGQLRKMMHALGMDNKDAKDGVFEAYRRCSLYDKPEPDWEELVEMGYAMKSLCSEGWYIVTEKGMQAVADTTRLMIRYTLEFEPKREK